MLETDLPNQLKVHYLPIGASDRFALAAAKSLRRLADTFFAKKYGHRAIVLKTVAAVPGMVGAMLTHLRCLRRMDDDKGWIRILMDEAENQRMHLMTFVEVRQPTPVERAMVIAAQWLFYVFFFGLYLCAPMTAHRLVAYFEEDAVVSYTAFLAEIDQGRSPNLPAPTVAKRYWNMPDDATLRDVVIVVRADEAHHRDVNHGFANALAGLPQGDVAASPEHVETKPDWRVVKRAA